MAAAKSSLVSIPPSQVRTTRWRQSTHPQWCTTPQTTHGLMQGGQAPHHPQRLFPRGEGASIQCSPCPSATHSGSTPSPSSLPTLLMQHTHNHPGTLPNLKMVIRIRGIQQGPTPTSPSPSLHMQTQGTLIHNHLDDILKDTTPTDSSPMDISLMALTWDPMGAIALLLPMSTALAPHCI